MRPLPATRKDAQTKKTATLDRNDVATAQHVQRPKTNRQRLARQARCAESIQARFGERGSGIDRFNLASSAKQNLRISAKKLTFHFARLGIGQI